MQEASVAGLIQGRSVITEAPQSSVREAARIMAGHRIGAVPVVDGRHLIGIFTERDVLTRVIAAGRDVDQTRLEEVMTRRPETVSVECPLSEALEVMLDGRFRHLPVMADGEVIGVISMRDIRLQHHKLWAQGGEVAEPV
ncbi:MAG: CBS domain-containing protein [Defluviicoccus sp.]|nr:MAG: CBS domain-containing protein [Defluviicoccus sp.]